MKRILLLNFLLCVIIFLGGCVTVYNPATGKKESVLLDDKVEVDWGKSLARDFIAKNKIIDDEKLVSRVNNIGEKIAQVSYRNYLQYHFYIINEDVLNAFALPGGFIFVYNGLLDKVNDDELAFVLSHEVGHVCARHAVKRLGPALGFNLASIISAIVWDKPEYKQTRESAGEIVNMIFMGYSRQDEYQADNLGIEGVVKTGFNPNAAITLFKKFQELEKKEKNRTPIYLRTHPFPDQRIVNAREKIKQLIYIIPEGHSG